MPRTSHEEYWASAESKSGRRTIEDETSETHRLLDKTLSYVENLRTAIDVGAGSGRYALALKQARAEAEILTTDINISDVENLSALGFAAYPGSIIENPLPGTRYDLVMAMGLLSCIPPEHLDRVTRRLYDACRGYLLVRDYALPEERQNDPYVERGYNKSSLFQRNYARILPLSLPFYVVFTDVEEVPSSMPVHWTLLKVLF